MTTMNEPTGDETSAGPGNVIIKTKYDGRCRVCRGQISAGETVYYNKSLAGSKVWHTNCVVGSGIEPKRDADRLLKGLRERLQERQAEKALADPADVLEALRSVEEAKTAAAKALTSSLTAIERTEVNVQELHKLQLQVAKVEATYRELIAARGKEIVVKDSSGATIADLGLQHEVFPLLLQASTARDHSGHRLNIWLSGPAGSGKTSAAKSVAKALGLRFFFTGAIDTEYKLLGFINAQGSIVSRPFREAWTSGGVFLKDEIDGSHPSALLALNAALANGICDFPDGAVERHPDFLCIAAANTWGQGATTEYVGRTRLDAASLDRFVQLSWPIDEHLERATAPNKEWCARVQACRQRVKSSGVVGHMITPRATYFGSALLAAGMSIGQVETMTLRKGLSEEQWAKVSG